MEPCKEEPTVVENSAYNPFPEPQTIPAGWDMSEYLLSPRPPANVDEDDSDES